MLNDVMTATEAAKRWGLYRRTITNACAGQKDLPPRLKSDECRKSEGTWLVTRQGMERLYGAPKK